MSLWKNWSVPVDEPNENNAADLEVQVAVTWIVVHLQKSKKYEVDREWVKTGGVPLLISHKRKILSGEDVIINFAQKLLKKQFPAIGCLRNTVLQEKKQNDIGGQLCLQVIHSSGNNRIAASNIHQEESNRVIV